MVIFMKINNAGYNFVHGSDFLLSRPNGSGDSIILLVKTAAYFTFNGVEMLSPPNSVVLFKQGTPQSYRAAEETYINDWIHFDLDEEDIRFIENLKIPFDTPIPLDDISILSQMIKNVGREKYSENLYKEDSMNMYVKLMFIKISEKMYNRKISETPHYDELSNLRSKIYNSPACAHSIKELAAEMMMSQSYFQHLYKHVFGISAIADVVNSRIEHSKYLLSSTDFLVSHIAKECGYNNEVHFMRQFKETVGITPSEYRRQFKFSGNEVRQSLNRNPYVL